MLMFLCNVKSICRLSYTKGKSTFNGCFKICKEHWIIKVNEQKSFQPLNCRKFDFLIFFMAKFQINYKKFRDWQKTRARKEKNFIDGKNSLRLYNLLLFLKHLMLLFKYRLRERLMGGFK